MYNEDSRCLLDTLIDVLISGVKLSIRNNKAFNEEKYTMVFRFLNGENFKFAAKKRSVLVHSRWCAWYRYSRLVPRIQNGTYCTCIYCTGTGACAPKQNLQQDGWRRLFLWWLLRIMLRWLGSLDYAFSSCPLFVTFLWISTHIVGEDGEECSLAEEEMWSLETTGEGNMVNVKFFLLLGTTDT